jgi:hypothetical protein
VIGDIFEDGVDKSLLPRVQAFSRDSATVPRVPGVHA